MNEKTTLGQSEASDYQRDDCPFCGLVTADNCETVWDIARCAHTPKTTDVPADAGLPPGFHWEYRDGEDGGGSISGPCWPATRYRRAVGPWEVERQGGRAVLQTLLRAQNER